MYIIIQALKSNSLVTTGQNVMIKKCLNKAPDVIDRGISFIIQLQ